MFYKKNKIEKKGKILVVDDEPDIVEALKHFITNKGYGAVGALSGEEALKVLEKEAIDLILLDLQLPGLKGSEIAAIVKEKYPNTKIIVITAYPEELDKKDALGAMLTKPVGIQELYKKILDTLNQEKSEELDIGKKEGIKARVLLIKAKLLFYEPCPSTSDILQLHFKGLSDKGEKYELEAARDALELKDKIKTFEPDILVFNMAYLESLEKDFLDTITQNHPNKQKEIIIYRVKPSGILDDKELERLTKTIQAVALKNGLIEIIWVNI